MTLRDGHYYFGELIIGGKCDKLELLELCWFMSVKLTRQGGKDAKLLLVQSNLLL